MPSRILIDLEPLRGGRDFRRLFAAQLAGVFGSQLTLVVIAFQVYGLTHSSLQVGAVSLAQTVPLVLGALVGGAVGDLVDRRHILVTAYAALALGAGAMAYNASSVHPSVAAIYVIGALTAGAGGVASTACNAAVPALVGPDKLVAAYASMQVVDQLGMVVAPALSGILLGTIRAQWVYALVAGAYALTAALVLRISAAPPSGERQGLGSLVEGVRYLRGRHALQGAFLIDLNAMVFGMPRALFPALAQTVFHGGADTLGLLFAAPGMGALVGALTTGWLPKVRAQGVAVVVAVSVWGVTVVLFGLVHVLWIALVLLVVAGWADVLSAVLRTTILQSAIPEAMRNRISALQIAVVEGGPRLGDLEAGVVANLTSTEFSVISGGIACIVGAAAVAGLLPGFRNFRRRSAPDELP